MHAITILENIMFEILMILSYKPNDLYFLRDWLLIGLSKFGLLFGLTPF